MRAARWFALVAAATLAGASMVSCSQGSDSQPCMPPKFSLSQDAASPGGSITVSAADASCDPRYGENAQIQVEVMDGSGVKIVDELAPMNDAGGFSVQVEIPASAVPGPGSVSAYPYDLDWCDDTGKNNRVGAVGGQDITLVSCVMPSKPLQIEP